MNDTRRRGSAELVQALRRLARGRADGGRKASSPVDIGPGSTFEALLAQRLSSVEERLEEVRGRLNGLFFLLLGSIAVQTVLRVVGL